MVDWDPLIHTLILKREVDIINLNMGKVINIFRVLLLLLTPLLFVQWVHYQETKRTVYTVGDSTVKNGRGDGADGLWGWGDVIVQFLDTTKVKAENHALGGTSSRTYQDKGLWDSVYVKLKKGDMVLIQFGHNDNGPINDDFRARGTLKGTGDESIEIDNMLTGKHEVVHTYGWYIRKLVTDAKKKGAIPIVLSPIPRNEWIDGKVARNDHTYGLWARQVAHEEHVSFIDLNETMARQMEDMGEKSVTGTYFFERDHTHTTAQGAVLAASIIAKELKLENTALKAFVLDQPKIVRPSSE
ncbi:rhamnogalacturonan acetylesterase [Pareuzebyella sediminis]|uniref:rhamnogalacturonan acetylesterase n=1 Tax=Pareuzebyella sediminis TaxID=2607998 RepID=UPI001E445826|nr:rhamnogalacturonan acetylesterase [Pareuzebyella sediminis]